MAMTFLGTGLKFSSIEYEETNPFLLLPNIDRVDAMLMASHLVPVRPMNEPTGRLHYVDLTTDQKTQTLIDMMKYNTQCIYDAQVSREWARNLIMGI